MAEVPMIEVLWRRRQDAILKTGRPPKNFSVTPAEFTQLRYEAKPWEEFIGRPGQGVIAEVHGIPLVIEASNGQDQ